MLNYSHLHLSNGLPVILIPMKGVSSVTTLVLTGAGSAYEDPEISGISHFLEHMFFKGGELYPTPKSVSQAIDAVGGEFNAFTGKEYAGYYTKSASRHIDVSIRVLADMLTAAQFPPQEIDKERGVIIEEMNMYQDMPMHQIFWNFERHVFGDQAYGWDTIGTKKVIQSVQREDFLAYKDSLYTPDNMVVVLAGSIPENTIEKLESAFSPITGTATRKIASYQKHTPTVRVQIDNKKTEQTNCMIGGYAPDTSHPDYIATRVLSALMGGMMSSRLFQNIREEKGLCYSVRTMISGYSKDSLLSVRMGVDSSRLLLALSAVRDEFREAVTGNFTDEEIERAKQFIIGHTVLNLEETNSVAEWFAESLLLKKEIKTPQEIIADIESVSREDLQRVAEQVFAPENQFVSIIGPHADMQEEIEALFVSY